MDVSCPDCRSVFRVDPAKVPPEGVRARCSVCGHVIPVLRPRAVTAAAGVAAVPGGAPGFDSVAASAGASIAADQLTNSGTPGSSGPGVRDAEPEQDEVALTGFAVATGVATPEQAGSAVLPPVSPEREFPARQPVTVEPLAPAPVAPAPVAPEPVAPQPLVTEARPAQPRLAPRRVNPYLANDPAQKARRLARALVSDLVAYNPQKREEGLRAGTLKELFRDDVRRSWQEYVDQVGANVAESTPHFQDALNDILAGGRRVF